MASENSRVREEECAAKRPVFAPTEGYVLFHNAGRKPSFRIYNTKHHILGLLKMTSKIIHRAREMAGV